ncbi:DUF58 domain-containing protein [Planktothrix sp. FACHB-1375]|uniref:DUF58 domain-containing protein n=3 Tax=Oscillatoriophycideae TaxID=1301283 RepID=A0A926VB16_9CYAN|nr:DUF58 domain-containing protein [Aerosakkonema funiforme FACHB-1375]
MKRFLYRLFHFTYALEQSRRRRLTTSGVIILLCLIISATLGLDTNQNLTYQIFTFLLSILIISIVSSRFFTFRFSAVRILPRFATVGVNLKYRIVIHNKTNKIQNNLQLLESFADPRPTFPEFIATPEPEEEKRNAFDRYVGYYRWVWLIARKRVATAKAIDLPPLPPNSKTEIVYEIAPAYRGVIRFADLTVIRPDVFGLFNACVTNHLPQSLLVLPKLYNVPPIKLPGARRYQSGGVALASSVGDSEEFRSLREYRPGDSLRKIHWKSWAKVGKPIVKEEQDEFFVRHALILDTFQSVKYSQILEEAIAIAASLACEVQTQESLLDLMFVGHEAYCFTFGRGLSHTDKMLEILASVVACRDKSFDAIIPVVMERVSLLSGCICIFLCWDDDRKRLVNYLSGMGIHSLVLILTDADKTNNFDRESMPDGMATFRILNLGKIQEELMQL